LIDLLLLRLVAPGYRFLSDCHPVALFGYVSKTISPEAFAQAQQAAAGLGMIARQQSTVRVVLAKMCLHTGKNLDELDADDFAEAHAFCVDHIGHQWPGMHGAWQVCATMGILAPNSTLRCAQRTGQRSVADLVDDYQLHCQPVRDLLVRYLEERKPSLDYASLRNNVTQLVGLFWADLEAHHPGRLPRPAPGYRHCVEGTPAPHRRPPGGWPATTRPGPAERADPRPRVLP
jgi:hypothetical protein